MALYFLKSSRLRATAGDRPAVSSHAGSLRELLVKTERCLPHTPLGTEAQVLDHDHWWSGVRWGPGALNYLGT